MKKNTITTALKIIMILSLSASYSQSAETDTSTGLFSSDSVTTATDSASSTITSVVGEVNEVLGGIGGFVEGILGNFSTFSSGIDSIFDSFNMGDVGSLLSGDNELLGCLGSNLDLSSILGGGICSLLSVDALTSNSTANCLMDGSSIDLGSLDAISSICKNPLGRGQVTTNASGETVSTEGYNNLSYEIENQTFTDYTPTTIAAISGAESFGLSIDADDKPMKEVYPNGKTPKELLGDGGGVQAKVAREKPNSSTAKAWQDEDTDTQIMKDYASKLNKTSDNIKLLNESTYTLPLTEFDVITQNNKFANLVGNKAYPDLGLLFKYLVSRARSKYQEDTQLKDSKTLDAYYKREKEVFAQSIKDSELLPIFRYVTYMGIQMEYETKKDLLKKEKGYIPNSSETRASLLPKKNRNRFRRLSIMQSHEKSLILVEMQREKREWKEAINRTIDRAYPASSIFRGDIAKKEIDEMLKAVDATIH